MFLQNLSVVFVPRMLAQITELWQGTITTKISKKRISPSDRGDSMFRQGAIVPSSPPEPPPRQR